MKESDELVLRVRALEDWKVNVEKKFYGASCVAAVLGFTALFSGIWINKLYERTSELEARIEFIDSSTKYWEEQTTQAVESLQAEKSLQVSQIAVEIDARLSDAEDAISLIAKTKKNELMSIGPQDVISSLQDGTAILNLKELSISNKDGVKVVTISSDRNGGFSSFFSNDGGIRKIDLVTVKGHGLTSHFNSEGKLVSHLGASADSGEGILQLREPESGKTLVELFGSNKGAVFGVYSPTGETQFSINIDNGLAYSEYYNSDGKNIARLGQFSDSDRAFLRFYNPTNNETLAELSGGSSGGRIFQYNNDGKRLVYVGPNSNSGDGLVNVYTPDGYTTRSLYPIK